MKLPDFDLATFEKTWLSWILRPEDEKILWAGRPKSLAWYDGSVAVLLGIPFWIPAAYFALTDITAQPGLDSPWQQFFVRALTIFISALLILFPIWQRYKARHTVYVLTRQRAIILSPRLSGRPHYRIYPLHAEMIRDRRVNKRGVGSLVFDYGFSFIGIHHLIRWPIGFLNIPDFAVVDHLLLHELYYRHGLTPDTMPDRPLSSLSGAAVVQFIMGILLLLMGATHWINASSLPPGWVRQQVSISYAHADRTPGRDGAFLMQMPDGNHYRIPLSGSCGKHREGDKVYIIYPPDNPLQARLDPGSPAKKLVSCVLSLCGLLLLAHGILYHLTLRNKSSKHADNA